MQPHPVIQPFLDYLKFEKRYSRHTLLAYQNDLVAFFDYMVTQYGDTGTVSLTHMHIRSWLATLKDDEMKSRSINRKISSLKSFFRYQIKMGLIIKSPMLKIIAPKNEKRLPQFVAEADMETLLAHVEFPDNWQGQTERLVLHLFYNTGNSHQVTAIAETLEKTNLYQWRMGQWINLERSLLVSSRLDGHFVQGHVDTTGVLRNSINREGSQELEFEFPEQFAPLVIEKGSICINGVSLTAWDITSNSLKVGIIPYTFKHTNLQHLEASGIVNLEFDMIGKYITRKLNL